MATSASATACGELAVQRSGGRAVGGGGPAPAAAGPSIAEQSALQAPAYASGAAHLRVAVRQRQSHLQRHGQRLADRCHDRLRLLHAGTTRSLTAPGLIGLIGAAVAASGATDAFRAVAAAGPRDSHSLTSTTDYRSWSQTWSVQAIMYRQRQQLLSPVLLRSPLRPGRFSRAGTACTCCTQGRLFRAFWCRLWSPLRWCCAQPACCRPQAWPLQQAGRWRAQPCRWRALPRPAQPALDRQGERLTMCRATCCTKFHCQLVPH